MKNNHLKIFTKDSLLLILILSFVSVFPLLILTGCGKSTIPTKEKKWKFYKQIKTGNAKPNGIVYLKGMLWISDTPDNRVLEIDTTGKIIKEFKGFKRPMHISLYKDKIFVSEFLADSLKSIDVNTGKVYSVPFKLKPDAPAGIAVDSCDTAVADFYNHRIILKSNGETITIGKKGHANGELFYPTDAAFSSNLLYVADAYNNRVQVFNKEGKFQKVIGSGDSIKTALGIFVDGKNIFVAGFDNNRVLIYDGQGNLEQKITDSHLSNPSDIFVHGDKMFIANYNNNSVTMFSKD